MSCIFWQRCYPMADSHSNSGSNSIFYPIHYLFLFLRIVFTSLTYQNKNKGSQWKPFNTTSGGKTAEKRWKCVLLPLFSIHTPSNYIVYSWHNTNYSWKLGNSLYKDFRGNFSVGHKNASTYHKVTVWEDKHLCLPTAPSLKGSKNQLHVYSRKSNVRTSPRRR